MKTGKRKRRTKKKQRNHKVGKGRTHKPLGPRQAQFFQSYADPKSETYGNAYRSALKAGYGIEYAEEIKSRMPAWLDESLASLSFIQDTEKHFREVLAMPSQKQVMGPFGPLFIGKGKKRKPLIDYHMPTIGKKTEVAMFLAEHLAPNKYGKKEQKELPPLQTIIVINAPNGATHRVHTVGETVASTGISDGQKNN